jgi:hypothetical protein
MNGPLQKEDKKSECSLRKCLDPFYDLMERKAEEKLDVVRHGFVA